LRGWNFLFFQLRFDFPNFLPNRVFLSSFLLLKFHQKCTLLLTWEFYAECFSLFRKPLHRKQSKKLLHYVEAHNCIPLRKFEDKWEHLKRRAAKSPYP